MTLYTLQKKEEKTQKSAEAGCLKLLSFLNFYSVVIYQNVSLTGMTKGMLSYVFSCDY